MKIKRAEYLACQDCLSYDEYTTKMSAKNKPVVQRTRYNELCKAWTIREKSIVLAKVEELLVI